MCSDHSLVLCECIECDEAMEMEGASDIEKENDLLGKWNFCHHHKKV